MLIESEFKFDAPREALYDSLHDPEILSGALPGTVLEITTEDRYEGEMEVSVGPVTAARFTVVVELKDMHVEGKGKAGFVSGIANVAFDELDGGTLMKYRADLQVGGRVASVGQRLLDSVGKTMSKQGLEAVNRSLMERLAPQPVADAGSADTAGAAIHASAPVRAGRRTPAKSRRMRFLLVAAIAIGAALVLLL
jgi:carbon monoxide dehydrogenase subunit G